MIKAFFIFVISLLLSLAHAAGVPHVASDNIMATFENFPSTAYSAASTTALGTVYVLRADAKATMISWDSTTIQEKLSYVLYMGGKSLGKRFIGDINHQRIDEVAAGARNQCVAFAKAMTGAGATSTWVKGQAISSIFPNGQAPSQWMAEGMVRPGTMIAYFAGSTKYPNTSSSHVAIVLNVVADVKGRVVGVNVIDQNGMDAVVMNGMTVSVGDAKTFNPSGGTIIKHFIPWSSTSTKGSFSFKNYHVVTDGQYQYT